MEKKNKRALILTADAGFGHRSAANAVAAAFEETYGHRCQVEILNPLDDKRTPVFLRDSQHDYDRIVRNMPELYRFGYDASDATLPSTIIERALTVLLYEVMEDITRKYRPDAILTTYPLYQSALHAVHTLTGLHIPLLTVVTDLATVHRMWFNKHVDACLVPTTIVRDLALNYGIPEEKLQITGIPVNPAISKELREKPAIREELGWRTDLLTILAVGSKRVENLMDTLNVFNHYGAPLQLVVVAGKDKELYQELQAVDWHVPVKLYEYVKNLAPMMRAADGLVCKAGGLITTEALASGLPMMLIGVIPGQEEGNANYVINGGSGDLVDRPLQTLEILSHWLADDGKLLARRAENARVMGRPRAAYAAAKALWEAVLKGPEERSLRLLPDRKRLEELLDNFDISWIEALPPEA